MKNFTPRIFVAFSSLLILFATSESLPQDTSAPSAPTSEFLTTQRALCTKQELSAGLQRTYNFREFSPEGVRKGAYGKKPWYSALTNLIPFLGNNNTEQYAANDIRELRKHWGRPVALGESKRSKEIRLGAKQKLVELQNQGEQNWQEWLKQNPQAAEEERKKAEIRIRFQGLAATNLPKFDWRDFGLDVGEAQFQGWECDTCWAFATVDAMQSSRRLAAMRANKTDFDETVRPNVRQLLSCMMPKPKDPNDPKNYCAMNWNGESFSFMVDKGLPLGGASKYGSSKFDWECSPDTYVKALTWDFVSAVPQSVPPAKLLKEALVIYGPLVTAMRMDNCLFHYADGVFNEEQPDSKFYHYVLIVGWDDSKNNGKGAWRIKNSYGKDWGEEGFAWVEYGSNVIGTFAAFVVADPKEEERLLKEMMQAK